MPFRILGISEIASSSQIDAAKGDTVKTTAAVDTMDGWLDAGAAEMNRVRVETSDRIGHRRRQMSRYQSQRAGIVREKDGWIDGWVDGWMDGWMDG